MRNSKTNCILCPDGRIITSRQGLASHVKRMHGMDLDEYDQLAASARKNARKTPPTHTTKSKLKPKPTLLTPEAIAQSATALGKTPEEMEETVLIVEQELEADPAAKAGLEAKVARAAEVDLMESKVEEFVALLLAHDEMWDIFNAALAAAEAKQQAQLDRIRAFRSGNPVYAPTPPLNVTTTEEIAPK